MRLVNLKSDWIGRLTHACIFLGVLLGRSVISWSAACCPGDELRFGSFISRKLRDSLFPVKKFISSSFDISKMLFVSVFVATAAAAAAVITSPPWVQEDSFAPLGELFSCFMLVSGRRLLWVIWLIINIIGIVYNDMPMVGREGDFVGGSWSCSIIQFNHRITEEGWKEETDLHLVDVFVRLIEFVAIFS